MRPLREKSYSSWPSRTRSGKDYGRAIQLSVGDAKEKNGADLMTQDKTFTDDSVISEHEFQTQAETPKDWTQLLDDFTDGFGSELDDALCNTQVLEDSEDTCQVKKESLISEQLVSIGCKDNNGSGLEDMEGDTQILDDPIDMSHNQLLKFGTHLEENCKENLSIQIPIDHCDQLCPEGLVTASDGGITVSNGATGGTGNGSLREMDCCKSSSDCLTDGTMDHTSGYAPPIFTKIPVESTQASAAAAQSRLEKKNSELNCSISSNTNQSSQNQDRNDTKTSGYVPPRFTEIRVEAWLAYGLEVKKRALSANTAAVVCSVGSSPPKEKHFDKENDKSVKGSPSNAEGTNDADFTAFNDPINEDFRNVRKVKSSAVRKLFAEELVPQTEAGGITSTGKDDSEPATGEGGINAAGLSYIDSQEPNDLAHTKALDFVEKFLTDNLIDIDTNYRGGSRVKNTTAVAHINCKENFVKKSILRSTVGYTKAFDWDDSNEDEGGGAFFCKLREKTSKKESHFVKSAPLRSSNSGQLDNMSECFKGNEKKRKLTYSDSSIVSQSMKKTAKNVEGNTKGNVINVRNPDRTGNNTSHQNKLDLPSAGKDVNADTLTVKESLAEDTFQLNTKEKGTSEGVSMGRTRKGSYIKALNVRKRAQRISHKVSDNYAHSNQISAGSVKEMSWDAPTQNQDAKLIEQLMEIPVSPARTTRSRNSQIPIVLTSKCSSSSIDPGQMGQVKQTKPTQSKAKSSSRSITDQSHQMLNKNEIPRRSCRLNKVTKLEDVRKQQVSQCSNDCTSKHSSLTNDKEAMRLPLQESLQGLTSGYSLKRLTGRSTLSNEQKRKKITFSNCELSSKESEQHVITNGRTEDLKINGPKKRRKNDDKVSYRNNKNQGKNSVFMMCTRQTRTTLLQNRLNLAETVHDDFINPIEQPAELCHAKRSRTTSPIGHDPVEENSKDTSIRVTSDQICQVHPVEHHIQFKPRSHVKIVDDCLNISSNRHGIPLRRSHRQNGSSTLEDLSARNVNKQASAGPTEEQLSHTDFGTSVRDTTHKLKTSPGRRTFIPCMDCATPTNSVKPSEEASPICMGKEYYKISCNRNLSASDLKKAINSLVSPPPKGMFSPRDSQKRRVMTDVRVLFSSHLDENTLKSQKKILNRLGVSLASSPSDATHFIANKFVRTKNMLEAIALSKPVVTPLWLYNCCETRFPIDEKRYILRDVKKEREFCFSMAVSLERALRQPLLQKRRVFITPNTKPGKEVIACLVKAVGGQVIGRITWSALRRNNIGDNLLILTCEEDFAICEPFMQKGAKVYSSELLLNGIVTQRLELERYRLFDDHRKRSTRRDG